MVTTTNDFLDSLKNPSESQRPTWDEVWSEMAHIISMRSLDPRTRVGAVIVTDDNTQVLAVGYNGDHRGGPNEVESHDPGQSGFILLILKRTKKVVGVLWIYLFYTPPKK